MRNPTTMAALAGLFLACLCLAGSAQAGPVGCPACTSGDTTTLQFSVTATDGNYHLEGCWYTPGGACICCDTITAVVKGELATVKLSLPSGTGIVRDTIINPVSLDSSWIMFGFGLEITFDGEIQSPRTVTYVVPRASIAKYIGGGGVTGANGLLRLKHPTLVNPHVITMSALQNSAELRYLGWNGIGYDTFFVCTNTGEEFRNASGITQVKIQGDSGNVYLSRSLGVGTPAPGDGDRVEVAGVIHSTSGGVRFPDGTLQTTAAAASGWTKVSGFVTCRDTTDKVGIGSSSPTAKLDVWTSSNTALKLANAGSTSNFTLSASNSAGTCGKFQAGNGSTGYPAIPVGVAGYGFGTFGGGRFVADSSGTGMVAQSKGAGPAAEGWAFGTGYSGWFHGGQGVRIDGNLCYTGSAGACSDVRYKRDVAPLSGSLARVMQLQGITYRWKLDEYPDHGFDNRTHLGFVAQEVEELYPEMVMTDKDGYKSVDYGRLTPALVEAIKEQQQEISAHKVTIATLSSRLGKLEEMMTKLAKADPDSGSNQLARK